MIQAENLFKNFDDNQVLQGLNLVIENGQTMVIAGRSGCGKSVFLKIIIGLIKPDDGRVLVDGEDIVRMPYRRLRLVRRKFGMVFQGSALFDSMTVEENVGLALRRYSDLSVQEVNARIRRCLEVVEMEGTENLYPSELSGGMKKRVALARAVASNPEFILYDEPTTGLDPVTARAIDRLILNLRQEFSTTSVVVTHDMESAFMVGDRIAMLHEGRIYHQGTPGEFRHTHDPIIKGFIDGTGEAYEGRGK